VVHKERRWGKNYIWMGRIVAVGEGAFIPKTYGWRIPFGRKYHTETWQKQASWEFIIKHRNWGFLGWNFEDYL